MDNQYQSAESNAASAGCLRRGLLHDWAAEFHLHSCALLGGDRKFPVQLSDEGIDKGASQPARFSFGVLIEAPTVVADGENHRGRRLSRHRNIDASTLSPFKGVLVSI